jgi:hypothetical protein
MSDTVQPYPAGTKWTFQVLGRPDLVRTEALAYLWEPNRCWITDDYLPEEITPRELWDRWVEEVKDWLWEEDRARYAPGDVSIGWHIRDTSSGGTAEGAPHRRYDPPVDPFGPMPEDFLKFHSHPVHAITGEPLNWLRLPVLDKGWSAKRSDKGGFIQELLGWKPAPLQPVMKAAGIA